MFPVRNPRLGEMASHRFVLYAKSFFVKFVLILQIKCVLNRNPRYFCPIQARVLGFVCSPSMLWVTTVSTNENAAHRWHHWWSANESCVLTMLMTFVQTRVITGSRLIKVLGKLYRLYWYLVWYMYKILLLACRRVQAVIWAGIEVIQEGICSVFFHICQAVLP